MFLQQRTTMQLTTTSPAATVQWQVKELFILGDGLLSRLHTPSLVK